MDKRIIDLKKQIIKENVDKIKLLSDNGLIKFSKEFNLKMYDDIDSETNYVTAIQISGDDIMINAFCDDVVCNNYAEFMDLEELDYNISSVLDDLIKNRVICN